MEFREEGEGNTGAAQGLGSEPDKSDKASAILLLDWVVLTGALLSCGNPANSALEICALLEFSPSKN